MYITPYMFIYMNIRVLFDKDKDDTPLNKGMNICKYIIYIWISVYMYLYEYIYNTLYVHIYEYKCVIW
jgi:hypothetical protein